MPAPNENLFPEDQQWKFVQKNVSFPQVRELVVNIYENDQAIVDDNLKETILSFLNGNKVSQWSDYWVTIINMLGLAYIDSQERLNKTQIVDYLYFNQEEIEQFFYYWALKFQFPFAKSKHAGFKTIGKVVQPSVVYLQAMVNLYDYAINSNQPFSDYAYLTYDEIILVLHKINSMSEYEILEKTNEIINNRRNDYDYSEEKIEGYTTLLNNFSGRAKLYLEKSGLINFDTDNNKIYIPDSKSYLRAKIFLAYKTEGLCFDSEIGRRKLFMELYGLLVPGISELAQKIEEIDRDYLAVPNKHLVKILHNDLYDAGVYSDIEFLERFILSLKTKPFLILSGISGVGKSILPRTIMSLIKNYECQPVAVAPEWTDNSDMLGYFNIDNEFVIGEFTSIVMKATDNPSVPYFIVLDEMNLSKVELYFAQVLSNIESRKYNSLNNKTESIDYLFNSAVRMRFEKLMNSDQITDELKKQYKKLSTLKFVNNIYIIGTVNVDESTYPFSKKVLDRANVIEINEAELYLGLDDLGIVSESNHGKILIEDPLIDYTSKPHKYLNSNFVSNISDISELKENWRLNVIFNQTNPIEDTLKTWIDELLKFNEVLIKIKLNFGIRLRDEVCIYLYQAGQLNLDSSTSSGWWEKYFDQQLVQKVLTRLTGDSMKFHEGLFNLLELCLLPTETLTDVEDALEELDLSDIGQLKDKYKYPLAAQKLLKMLEDIHEYGNDSTSVFRK